MTFAPMSRRAQPSAAARSSARRTQERALSPQGAASDHWRFSGLDIFPRSPGAPPALQRKCAECKEEEKKKEKDEETHDKLARKEAGGAAPPRTAPPIVHEVLRSAGTPLDSPTRALMEPRFGQDLSGVRIHTGSAAAASARAVNALAYTVGSHVVFDEGRSPAQRGNLSLLAHELTHVVQQGAQEPSPGSPLAINEPGDSLEREADRVSSAIENGMAAPGVTQTGGPTLSRWVSCADYSGGMALEPACPAREPGEVARSRGKLNVGEITTPEEGEIVWGFAIGSADASGLSSDPTFRSFGSTLAASTDRWEILGFTDCAGPEALNTDLRLKRANAVRAQLPAAARSQIDNASGAALEECVASNDTESNRKFNRSAVFLRTTREVTIPTPDVIQGIQCPPAKAVTAASLDEYITLMKCAEKTMGLSPREMLAVFRQLYYGKPWSASTNPRWSNVIPCSPKVPDGTTLPPALFDSLKNSQEVGGVDVGHVFAGMEAMTCPTSDVKFPVAGGLIDAIADLPNERFATWSGDLGAAVAAHVACPQLGADAAKKSDCGRKAGAQPLRFYFDHHSPTQDLEGDIDPFIMRAAEMGITCQTSGQQTFTPSRAISDVFEDYYLNSSSKLGTAHTNRYECLLQLLGASLTGTAIGNRPRITPALAHQIASFADLFFTKIKGGGITDTSDASDRANMRADAFTVVNWFLDYLESKL